ncbi:uncharacterized protein LOC112467046 [Temnothorax curvispinosus]|uniref:Uncharacterized protein LOC112467046 n=1 Tax=Temnothorax curvispinosus TaxID=300111 RepID=A0A6J1R8A6_9HYME|nr:uncharacterized protein LOC112467046 [Temnothorax curvispinosus]
MSSTLGRELEKFSVNEESATVGVRWKKWMRAFKLFIQTQAALTSERKQAFLLHLAGPEMQDVYYALDAVVPQGRDIYDATKTALQVHFSPQINVPYERHNFRCLAQQADETIDRYVIRLQQQAENCEFGDRKNEMIRDQITEKCNSNDLRRQLLKEGTALTFQKAVEIARLWEMSHRQAQAMTLEENKTEQVNQIKGRSKNYGRRENKNRASGTDARCFRCNYTRHFAKDKSCPARTSTCERCGKEGHFKIVCKTKMEKVVKKERKTDRKKV